MNDATVSWKMMHWKHEVAVFSYAILGILICCFTIGTAQLIIKYLLFLMILLVASYYDIQSKIIPDWIHILLILIGYINFDFTKALFGLLISPLPFLIMALIRAGSIGGGDIKLIGASGFALGYGLISIASMLSIVIAVCFYSLISLPHKKVKNRTFPFTPYFQVGCTMVILLGGI